MNVLPGLHRHHKGGFYSVLFIASESTNSRDTAYDNIVVYVSLTTGRVHVRELAEFTELVPWPRTEMADRVNLGVPLFIREGTKHPRFMRWPEPKVRDR